MVLEAIREAEMRLAGQGVMECERQDGRAGRWERGMAVWGGQLCKAGGRRRRSVALQQQQQEMDEEEPQQR